jgi:hypothetical protein
LVLSEAEAQALLARVKTTPFKVLSTDDKPYTSRPYPPFTTSTLQQQAATRLRFAAKKLFIVLVTKAGLVHIANRDDLAIVELEPLRDIHRALVAAPDSGQSIPSIGWRFRACESA